MDGDPVTCVSFLQCLCDPVQEVVLASLGTVVYDLLSSSFNRILTHWTIKRAVEVPLAVHPVVGREQTLLEIRKHLEDEDVGIIGVSGMSGVGKTTILKKINNDQANARIKLGFHSVIFVTVTRQPDVSLIQQEIGDRLALTLPRDDQAIVRAGILRRALCKKRLLLDDVWEKLDFASIGIPNPADGINKVKVLFATRSKNVCVDMGCQRRVEVSPFDETQSWNLFSKNFLPRVSIHSSPIIKALAEDTARNCGGLPLALDAMGKAMSNATTIGEWENALVLLRGSPENILGMEQVLSTVKSSFEQLKFHETKECLLYCCLFPEGYSIKMDKLVEYWIGEGFLDADRDIQPSISRARAVGYSIIRELKNMNLLESAGDEAASYVRMHTIVRKMALWLTGSKFGRERRFIVCTDVDDEFEQRLDLQDWKDARRISLMQQEFTGLPSPGSECPNLLTLLVAGKPLARHRRETMVVPPALFASMPVLRVLDLSRTNIRDLPRDVGSLSELRYLNLSWTEISVLPEELGELSKLRHLGLWGTVKLRHIPRRAIMGLTRLQRFFLHMSGCSVGFIHGGDVSEGMISLRDLNDLQKLEEFSVDIHDKPSLDYLAKQAGNLWRCIRRLRLVGISNLPSSSLFFSALGNLVNMECLCIEDCHQLEELQIVGGMSKLQSLRHIGLVRLSQLWNVTVEGKLVGEDRAFPRVEHIEIDRCDRLRDVGWLRQLSSLQKLLLRSCKGIQVLLPDPPAPSLAGTSTQPLLPKLRYVALVDLPYLKRITDTAEASGATLPALESLSVNRCPSLRRLPFTERRCCENIREIFGSREWWDSLDWRESDGGVRAVDEAPWNDTMSPLRSILLQVFRPLPSSSSSPNGDPEDPMGDECGQMFLMNLKDDY